MSILCPLCRPPSNTAVTRSQAVKREVEGQRCSRAHTFFDSIKSVQEQPKPLQHEGSPKPGRE